MCVRQRRLPLMARLNAHGREVQRPTRDGFRMPPGNRQAHKHGPPIKDEGNLARHELTPLQALRGVAAAPSPLILELIKHIFHVRLFTIVLGERAEFIPYGRHPYHILIDTAGL